MNDPLRPEPILRLKKDLKSAAEGLTATEARYVVDLYYQMQDYRKAAANQIRSMTKAEEPTFLISWAFDQFETMEHDIKSALNYYTEHEPSGMGRFSKEIIGIGPVIAAGLLAHIDISKCRTAGSIWRFAGLDPTSKWEKGKKRPWNARLKTLCWIIGQSFEKVSNKENSLYGRLLKERKAAEWRANIEGKLAAQAQAGAERVRKETQAYIWYSGKISPSAVRKILDQSRGEELSSIKATHVGDEAPMLPPGHIRQRAARWTVKLFLCHWFEEAYRRHYQKEPPEIYSIAMLGHAHKIGPEEH